MTLQQLHQVITIAESRSMNEASRKLFVSQPNLSAVVRELEEEAGITIFIRSNRGIVLTPEGEEFIGYAKQVVEQYHLLESRYISSASKKKFSVSMQHYTFAVKAFVEVVKAVGMEEYEFAVHETQTNQVIENVRNMKSELGILFLSKFNEAVLQKLFKENDVVFEELFTCDTYVYLWKGHPLAQRDVISMKELQEYPCLVFEQGKNNSFYFAEEMKSTYEYKKMIDPNLPLNDDTQKIILNTKGIFDDVRPELKRLLNFIDGRQPEDSFTQDLSKAVESAKRNEKWRHDYMTLQMAYDEKYREGLETGIQQGIERGIEQGITTSARRMLSSGKYSDSEISEITGLSVEQIQALKNSAK